MTKIFTPRDRVLLCACRQTAFTSDASGKFTLIVDKKKRHLLQDTSWTVVAVRSGSRRLNARATSDAPGIKRGQLLHRLASGASKDRQVRPLDGNLLNCTSKNLQIARRGDVRVMNSNRAPDKLVGVRYQAAPKWLRTNKLWSARIKVDRVNVHLGSWRTAEEAGCAFDRCARYLFGQNAVTNESLGLIAPSVVRTKACRKAGREARDRLIKYLDAGAARKIETYFAGQRTFDAWNKLVTRPTEQRVEIQDVGNGKAVKVDEAVDQGEKKKLPKERRANRRARKAAWAMAVQRRKGRAAKGMAELDAEMAES